MIPANPEDELWVSVRIEDKDDEKFRKFKVRAWAVVDYDRIEPVFVSDLGAMVTVSQYGEEMKEEGAIECDYEVQWKDGSVPS